MKDLEIILVLEEPWCIFKPKEETAYEIFKHTGWV